jgi:hypothetical protein
MTIRPKIRNAALVAGLAAVAATAWATNDAATAPGYIPDNAHMLSTSAEPPVQSVRVDESLAPNESVIAADAASEDRAVPVVEHGVSQPPLTIEERRLSLDERIQADVMDQLRQNPRLSGKIGVESTGARVILTGYTSTAAQADRAGRVARGVSGVRNVDNQIRPRIGGSV